MNPDPGQPKRSYGKVCFVFFCSKLNVIVYNNHSVACPSRCRNRWMANQIPLQTAERGITKTTLYMSRNPRIGSHRALDLQTACRCCRRGGTLHATPGAAPSGCPARRMRTRMHPRSPSSVEGTSMCSPRKQYVGPQKIHHQRKKVRKIHLTYGGHTRTIN